VASIHRAAESLGLLGTSGFSVTLLLEKRVDRNTRRLLSDASVPGTPNGYRLALLAVVIAFSNSSGRSDPTSTLSPLDSRSCTPRPLMGLLGLTM
jgi:hypothetical protein